MARYRLSPLAEQDLEAILMWTHTRFGEQGRLRYEALLVQAILDLAADPARIGSLSRPELATGSFTYHLRFSRDHVPASVGRVKKPRHFLLCRVASNDCLEIARVLHDSMDLPKHLPPEYRSPTADSGE